jgi:flagellar biosynthesis/type III secretory pathway chaperone
MTQDLAAALRHLAEVLQAENDVLNTSDIPRATILAEEKQEAVERFMAARSNAQVGALRSAGADIKDLAARLPELAERNRQLLARAIAVQTRVIGMIASAAAQAELSRGLRYTADGSTTSRTDARPVALSARA